jgi:hypothetical protein
LHFAFGMTFPTLRALLVAATIVAAGCDGTTCPPNLGTSAVMNGDGAAEAPTDGCTHDGCVVPLASIESVCLPTLSAATNNCVGTTVWEGPCGSLTHVQIQTANPIDDCWYDATTGALLGGVVRSDSGFTKVAGTTTDQVCPASTKVCELQTVSPGEPGPP